MGRLLSLVLLFAVFFSSSLFGYDFVRDVEYAEAPDTGMDIYFPRSAERQGAAGCVLMLHGGSWMGGDKEEPTLRACRLARQGYVVASINYTLYSEEIADRYTVNTVLDEIDAALAALSDFAAARGVRLVAAATEGYSAGAHLALLYAYTRGASAPVPVVFTAALAAPADLSLYGESGEWVTEMLTGIPLTDEMRGSGETAALTASVSPVSYVASGGVPTVVAHGERDTTVPVAHAEALTAALQEAGVPFVYHHFSHSDHTLVTDLGKRYAYNRTLTEFCRRYLDPAALAATT
ncbi:MAG: alpha/beta hydrolase [Clostridia bacterium]|nr:alpha/beta hydrolase [Clostridia bacterium]